MSLSLRLLLLDRRDCIYRLGIEKFDDMRMNPQRTCYPQFAGQRVRVVEAVVELVNRKPVRVVRVTFDILTFDESGSFDSETFKRQQFGRFEAAVTPGQSGSPPCAEPNVVDARSVFSARGGIWVPSTALTSTIFEAALGRLKCLRL